MNRNRSVAVLANLSLILLMSGLFAGPAAGQTPPTAIMTELRGLVHADKVEYTAFITGIFHYTQTELRQPRRLILDLEPVESRWAPSALAGQAFGIRAVRVTQAEPKTVRLEFDLAADVLSYGIKLTGDGLRVVFYKEERPTEIKAPVIRPEVEPPAVRVPAEKPTPSIPAVEKAAPPNRGLPSILLGASAVYQTLSDPRFLEIFDTSQGFGFGFDLVLALMPASRVRPALGVDYQRLTKSGFSTISLTPTRLTLEPVTISAFLLYDTPPVVPYFGAGVCFDHYGEQSDLHDTDGSATGYSLQAGMFLHFGRQDLFKMKVFARWTKVTALDNEREFELGGTAFGLTAYFGFL